uniref:Selenide, water dikinase 2 n=2 Tax=Zeugodacus cucurbitae TaxID=28588 RepID=A0A0A1WPV0_ZEUCU
MDCAVIPLARHKNYYLVQTVDYFYPLVNDPKIMGKIALANVVSDIYAVGVTTFDKLNMLVSVSTEFSELERDVIIPQIVEGFHESAKVAGIRVHVQSISYNPWCIIGGIASSLCTAPEIIMPSNAKAGDVIILTKPLGTQLATNTYLWMEEKNEKYMKIAARLSDDDIRRTFNIAVKSMIYLNKIAAQLMHKYKAHAATDVTGFGLLGHAKNLARFQKDKLAFALNKLPIITNVVTIGEILGQDRKLKSGKAVETSGGLLICLSADNAQAFCEDFYMLSNKEQQAWIVGSVKCAEERDAYLQDNAEIINVDQ